MVRKNNHKNELKIQWLDVWKQIQEIIYKRDAPLSIRNAALSDDTDWRVEGDEMHLFIPDIVQVYIEQNMDYFKPILLPFINSHHCTKLIYED